MRARSGRPVLRSRPPSPWVGSALLRSVSTPRATPPRQLNAQNCSNPRFRGSLGGGSASPPDPYENIPDPNGGGGGGGGGGTGNWRDASPTSYTGERSEPLDRAPMIILLGMLACPPLFGAVWQRVRRNRAAGSATAPPPAAGASPGPDDAFGAGGIGT